LPFQFSFCNTNTLAARFTSRSWIGFWLEIQYIDRQEDSAVGLNGYIVTFINRSGRGESMPLLRTQSVEADSLSCPLDCSHPQAREIGSRDGYRIARCKGCAHLFTINLPGEALLEEYYRNYSYHIHGLQKLPPLVFKRLDQTLYGMEKYRRLNRLLDVGFGAGAILEVGRRRGWNVFGIEHSSLAVEQALANGFSGAVHGDFLQDHFGPGSFDVVAMVELIEHLPEPMPFLSHAYRLLRPGGVLFLTTPNGNGLSGRFLATRWSVLTPPEHLSLFSPRSLKQSLSRCGFQKIRVKTQAVNPYELLREVRRRLGSDSGTSGSPPQHSSSSLNERLHATRTGQAGKSIANAVLQLSKLGDSLKVHAERS
jgi:2-polyprenyl-3-methyl-5-hydroxy-6-metoxy-1,4-benzoquinol methylase